MTSDTGERRTVVVTCPNCRRTYTLSIGPGAFEDPVCMDCRREVYTDGPECKVFAGTSVHWFPSDAVIGTSCRCGATIRHAPYPVASLTYAESEAEEQP